jgi:ribosomal subunit interface protein
MNVSYTYKNLSMIEKKNCENYFETKLPRVKKIVNLLYPEETQLELRAEKFAKKAAYNVSFFLKGSPSIFVSEDDHTLNEAIDLALDKLIEKLRKIREERKRKR